MLSDLIDVTLGDGCAEVLVVTGHDHLHEVLIVEHFVVVGVKILDYVAGIGLCRLLDAIVAKELQNFKGCNLAVLVTVNSLKGRMRFKSGEICEDLPLSLDAALTLRDRHEKPLEQLLVLVGEPLRALLVQRLSSRRTLSSGGVGTTRRYKKASTGHFATHN